MRIVSLALLFLLGYADAQQASQANPKSCRADVFVPESLKQSVAIPSPDNRFQAVLDEYREEEDSESGRLTVFLGKTLLGRYRLRGLSAGIFVKWSPDSRAFYLMWSNGGIIGGYDVRVFRVVSHAVREVFPMKIAETEFKRRHNCRTRGVNAFAVKWMTNSEQLMIATQVYPTSDCGAEMGLTKGYTVRLEDGQIVQRHSQKIIENEMKECPTPFWPAGLWDDNTLQQVKSEINSSARKP